MLKSLTRIQYFRNVTDDEILKAMNSITSNAVGPDSKEFKFLKQIFRAVSRQLRFIFNTIITSSKFPDSLKVGRVF